MKNGEWRTVASTFPHSPFSFKVNRGLREGVGIEKNGGGCRGEETKENEEWRMENCGFHISSFSILL
jgi:hypothetical protein